MRSCKASATLNARTAPRKGLRTALAFALAALTGTLAGNTFAQAGCPGVGGPIAITNFRPKDTLSYDVALIKGTLPAGNPQVTLSAGGVPATWPVSEGAFKALVRLKPGSNPVVVSAPGAQNACVDIVYIPDGTAKRVRLVVALPRDFKPGDPVFKSYPGEPQDLESAKKRLATGALLNQSLFGEFTYKAGLGHRAPTFMRNAQGDPDVLVVYGDYAKNDTSVGGWEKFIRIADKLKPYENNDSLTRFMVFTTLTRNANFSTRINSATFFPIEDDLYSWPQGLGEILARSNELRTRAQVALPGSEKDNTSLGWTFRFHFGWWFKTVGTGNLDVPSLNDSSSLEPFGGANAVPNLYTLFQSREASGAPVKPEMSFSAGTVQAVKSNPWILGPTKPWAALPTALIPKNLVQGLRYDYYEGPFDGKTDLSAISPKTTGPIPALSLSNRKVDRNYAFLFSAYLKVDQSGSIVFDAVSNGACRLTIDGKSILTKAPTDEKAANSVPLEAGYHRVQIAYIADSGQALLQLNWAASGAASKPIPASAFMREEVGVALVQHPISTALLVCRTPGMLQVTLSESKVVSLRFVSPNGASLGILFAGALSAGKHRFQIPANALNAMVVIEKATSGP